MYMYEYFSVNLIYVLLCLKEYYMTMLGPNSFKKAIEEAEKLSESLKLRFVFLLSKTGHTLLMHEYKIRYQIVSL